MGLMLKEAVNARAGPRCGPLERYAGQPLEGTMLEHLASNVGSRPLGAFRRSADRRGVMLFTFSGISLGMLGFPRWRVVPVR